MYARERNAAAGGDVGGGGRSFGGKKLIYKNDGAAPAAKHGSNRHHRTSSTATDKNNKKINSGVEVPDHEYINKIVELLHRWHQMQRTVQGGSANNVKQHVAPIAGRQLITLCHEFHTTVPNVQRELLDKFTIMDLVLHTVLCGVSRMNEAVLVEEATKWHSTTAQNRTPQHISGSIGSGGNKKQQQTTHMDSAAALAHITAVSANSASSATIAQHEQHQHTVNTSSGDSIVVVQWMHWLLTSVMDLVNDASPPIGAADVHPQATVSEALILHVAGLWQNIPLARWHSHTTLLCMLWSHMVLFSAEKQQQQQQQSLSLPSSSFVSLHPVLRSAQQHLYALPEHMNQFTTMFLDVLCKDLLRAKPNYQKTVRTTVGVVDPQHPSIVRIMSFLHAMKRCNVEVAQTMINTLVFKVVRMPVQSKWDLLMESSLFDVNSSDGSESMRTRTNLLNHVLVECMQQHNVEIGETIVQHVARIESLQTEDLCASVIAFLSDTCNDVERAYRFFAEDGVPESLRHRARIMKQMLNEFTYQRKLDRAYEVATRLLYIYREHGNRWPTESHGAFFVTQSEREHLWKSAAKLDRMMHADMMRISDESKAQQVRLLQEGLGELWAHVRNSNSNKNSNINNNSKNNEQSESAAASTSSRQY